jgi:hypothetical protein
MNPVSNHFIEYCDKAYSMKAKIALKELWICDEEWLDLI